MPINLINSVIFPHPYRPFPAVTGSTFSPFTFPLPSPTPLTSPERTPLTAPTRTPHTTSAQKILAIVQLLEQLGNRMRALEGIPEGPADEQLPQLVSLWETLGLAHPGFGVDPAHE